MAAVAAKLRITKQKNLFKRVYVHHGSLEGKKFACPVKSLERRVAHIQVHTSDGTAILCAYWDSVGRVNITGRDACFHMKFTVAKLGYPSRNIPLYRIDTHLNRAFGACAIKLAVFHDDIIRKIGRWLLPSNAFFGIIVGKVTLSDRKSVV